MYPSRQFRDTKSCGAFPTKKLNFVLEILNVAEPKDTSLTAVTEEIHMCTREPVDVFYIYNWTHYAASVILCDIRSGAKYGMLAYM